MNRHGDAVAFWAEPAGWRSVSRPRPSMPYSLLATHYQLLKITSRQVARSSPSPGRDLGFFFLCIIVDIVVDIALWWSWNCPRTTRRSLHLQRLRLLKMCFFFFIHNADSSSTDFATALSLCISGRSPNQQHSKNKDNVCAFCGTGEVDAR